MVSEFYNDIDFMDEDFNDIDINEINEVTDDSENASNSTLYLYCSVKGSAKTKSDFTGSLNDYIKINKFNMKIKNKVKINASAEIPESQSMEIVEVSLVFYDNPFSFVLLNNWNQGKAQTLDLKIQRKNPSNDKGDYIISLKGCVVQDLYQTIDKDFGVGVRFSVTEWNIASKNNGVAFS